MEYYNPKNSSGDDNLRVLEAAACDPEASYANDPAVREAFDSELRELAKQIVTHHPSLTQLLLSLSSPEKANPVHGRN
ncbi:MAG: hypothetical protein R3F31_05375 [Verrucomicrobiales bacterium]|nr:hypothetical protein [Akkermansiaceae bacterium]HRX54066.1 hypothetical protein [Verrucomicrobiales bacterium]